MRTYIQKRNNTYLIVFIALIIIYLCIRGSYFNLINELDTKYDFLQNLQNRSEQEENTMTKNINESSKLKLQLGFVLIYFSIVNFLILFKNFLTKQKKFYFFLSLSFLCWFSFALTQNFNDAAVRLSPEDDRYFLSLIIFTPYLFFIYKYFIRGTKTDITEETKIKQQNDLDSLDKMHEMGLLTTEELNQKKEVKFKQQIAIEVVNTNEYILLQESKNAGLLSYEEWQIKITQLINTIYIRDYK